MRRGEDPLRERLRAVGQESETEQPRQVSLADDGQPLPPPWLDREQPAQDRRTEQPPRARRPSRPPASTGAVADPPPVDGADWGVPISMCREQMEGQPVIRGREGIPVWAWVPHTDGHYHRVEAWAGEWTSKAVHLRWRDHAGAWSVWAHSSDIVRRPIARIQGLPATMRPNTVAGIHPSRRPSPE